MSRYQSGCKAASFHACGNQAPAEKLGITTLFVTHDQEECFSISDKVAVMNGGVIEQYDTPENIYRRPATEFVARFIDLRISWM